jgi:hypothetical protein
MNALCLLLLSTCVPGSDPAALQAQAGDYTGYDNQSSQWQPADQSHHHFLGRLWGHVHHKHSPGNTAGNGWRGYNQPDGASTPANGNVARNGGVPMNDAVPTTESTPTSRPTPRTESTPATAPVMAGRQPTVATEPLRLVPTPAVTPTSSAAPAAGDLARPLPRGEPVPVTTAEPPR